MFFFYQVTVDQDLLELVCSHNATPFEHIQMTG